MYRQPDEPWSFLIRVRRRWAMAALLWAGARAAGGGACIVLAAVILDRLWLPADLVLIALALTAGVTTLGYTFWVFWPLRKAPSDRQVARFVEEHVPELEDRLTSAADLSESAVGSGIHSLIVADAASQVRTIRLDRVVASAQIRHATALSAACGIALAVVLGLASESVGRAVAVARLYAFPNTIRIDVSPGDARLMVGQPLHVRAEISGLVDASGRTRALLQGESGGEWRDVEMQLFNGGFQFEFVSVDESFRYRVTAAGTRSEEYHVVALLVPHVTRIDVEYDYPAFTGLDRRLEIDGGDIYAPAGTAVTLTVHADKPIENGAVVLAGGLGIALALRDETTLTGGFEVLTDDVYRVMLSDAEGLKNPAAERYFIRTIDDRLPDVRIVRPEGDRSVTPLEEVTIVARADDDYGLARFEIVYAVRGGEEHAVPFPGPTDVTSRTGTHTLYIEDLGVTPGDFVTYYARALDVNRVKAFSESRSDIYFLDVVPFEQEFVEAQSQTQGGDGGTGLAELTAAQRAIIVATWKIDWAPEDIAAEDDVRTVARAQGELKLRVEEGGEQFGDGQRRGASTTFQQRAEGSLGLSVRAMADAEKALEDIQADKALPHEMAAFNYLLQAQAEIRRREVSRPQTAVGGGSGRPGQDLSALFDQELRRQQQTNYETRSPSGQPDTPESDALKRVRDLASRQDDLTRRQRELERRRAVLGPEELQRQLERLTREQTVLRRQAEEMTSTLNQLGEAAFQTSGSLESNPTTSTARSDGEQMREISEAMRGAASDLRRKDLTGASEWGRQALDSLRALEQELRFLNPEERQRAVSELQLVAQGLAADQARIAREADQLDAGAASRDTRVRLADEQARTADQVDALHESTEALARADANTEWREALEEVAGVLENERVAGRLRELADTLRRVFESSDGASEDERHSLTESARALADLLARTAEWLGRVPGDLNINARELSDQLKRARVMRERLADLERQIDALMQLGRSRESTASGDDPGTTAEDRTGKLERLGEAYEHELQRAGDLFAALRREHPSLVGRVNAANGWYDRSSPGTEAFKQDFARWDELRGDVSEALERFEASRSNLLSGEELRGRLTSGADEWVPETYRALVEAYYEALAAAERRR